MGSTGTGRFTDYPGSSNGKRNKSGGGSGEENDIRKCERAIGDISLEEVANCSFFKDYNNVPSIDTDIFLLPQLLGGRLVIATSTGEQVGVLPTRYNYLRQCLEQGYTYGGKVIFSELGRLPIVKIDLAPIK
ncbi:MAG: hypothetical protein HYS21_09055 [Deltaproteobacteria bacterium]|nr:hypothetical protein [Deltaproteobacteria bacterium]